MKKTVIQHVLSRLQSIGVKDIFGVAGDYAFPIEDAVCSDQSLRWVGCCNELNAAYAADGYARIHGAAALSTTYGVGELSAINGIAGSYAEYLPVFHLVGMPSSRVQAEHRLVHHTLGNGAFDTFYKMAEPLVCAQAVMTPENCVAETERLIAAAFRHRRPVYMGFPLDYANMPVTGTGEKQTGEAPPAESVTDKVVLEAAINAIANTLSASKTACILPGILISRFGLEEEATRLVDGSGLPFATMIMDKSVLEETHPNYIGMYDGRLMNEPVRAFVEGCDCILSIGAMLSDFNSGSFTAQIEPSKSINILQNTVRVGSALYENVSMKEVLVALTKKLSRKEIKVPSAQGLGIPEGKSNDKISVKYLYPRWQEMLKPNDILVAESGTVSLGLVFTKMPKGSVFLNQTLWGSIGWATPAAFGAALAAPERRTILVTGDGSHQLTVQEISQFYRLGLKPIIFVLNNSGYLIERLLCKNPEFSYNDLAQWHYHKLPEALGCDDWFTARVTTCGELDQVIEMAEVCDRGVYIEIVMDKYAAPPLAQKMHESREALYAG